MSGASKCGGYGHVGEFAEKQETVYVRGLRDLNGSERRRALDQWKRDLWLRRKTELAHQACHAHTLLHMRVKNVLGKKRKEGPT